MLREKYKITAQMIGGIELMVMSQRRRVRYYAKVKIIADLGADADDSIFEIAR